MTTAMTERDETTGTSPHRYHHTRTVEIAGHTVRTHVERGQYLNTSRAVAEVLTDQMTWTSLAADAPSDWWHNTPTPGPDIDDPSRFLSPVTERLLQRAATILAAPPTTRTISPHLHGAISALLATSYGFDAEQRIDPDEIAWAYTHGGALHIIEHPDGSVTFTKAHREDCPFITSRGTQECDEDCYYPDPSDVERKPGRWIPTTANFYDETGRRARWLGALHGNADPETLRCLDSGRLMLEATDPTTFADAVLALLDVFTEQGLGQSHHARDGWPWPWPDSRSTDWIYTFDRGRAWVITGRIWSYVMPRVDHAPQRPAATGHTHPGPTQDQTERHDSTCPTS